MSRLPMLHAETIYSTGCAFQGYWLGWTMTHEELLAKIEDKKELCKYAGFSRDQVAAFSALRAVVELHKPIQEDGKLWCQHEACYNHLEFLERDDCSCEYPCPTIQAIEKELK